MRTMRGVSSGIVYVAGVKRDASFEEKIGDVYVPDPHRTAGMYIMDHPTPGSEQVESSPTRTQRWNNRAQ